MNGSSMRGIVGVMKVFVIVGLVCLVSRPAAALTCDEVRSYVQMYGASAVLAYAKNAGATPQQIRRGKACLARDNGGARKRFGRVSSGSLAAN